MTGTRMIRRILAPALLAAALAGCGAQQPEPPLHEAMKLGASTGDISTECGLTFQLTAFPGDHRKDLASLESQAMASARSLASVYQRNPDWIYQGETVRQIVGDAATMLSACGLHEAEQALRRATSS